MTTVSQTNNPQRMYTCLYAKLFIHGIQKSTWAKVKGCNSFYLIPKLNRITFFDVWFGDFLSQYIPYSFTAAFFVKRSLIDHFNIELKRMSKDENGCF